MPQHTYSSIIYMYINIYLVEHIVQTLIEILKVE